MGSLEAFASSRVYFDTNIVIYILERPPLYERQVSLLLEALAEDGFEAVTGEITIAEVLAGAAKAGGETAIGRCIAFFESEDIVSLHPVTRDAFYRAGLVRAALSVSAPDAIHMATAIEAKCEIFLTNDRRLHTPAELRLVQFADLE
jgi:predicted nucleic acid-binding protein